MGAQFAAGTQPEDIAKSRAWTREVFRSLPEKLPFSFHFRGETISGIPEAWHPTSTSRRIDANISEATYQGADPDSGLTVRVEMQEYLDYPVVEWTVCFSNTGEAPTPLLSDIQAIDAVFTGEQPVLYHCNGDFYSEEGYTPQETPLPASTVLTFAPNGGRPCDGAFPYFRLQCAGGGVTLAVGWPAQWAATFTGTAAGVSVRAGQQETHLCLLPGETIRTPRMTVMCWLGDTARARNLWRRWYLAHILPKPDGRPLQPLLAVAATDDGEEFTAATEENQLRYLAKFVQREINFDIWWIDAGWYPCWNDQHERKWWLTGTWIPDPERFPHGFAPIAARAKEAGARLLIWFEPERVTPGSTLSREHPEWLCHHGDDRESNMLLNLGIPACRQWLTDHVTTLIQSSGIGVYRQDFNFPPLDYWRSQEADDRRASAKICTCRAICAIGMSCWRATPGCGSIPAPPAGAATIWRPCAARCRCITAITAMATTR